MKTFNHYKSAFTLMLTCLLVLICTSSLFAAKTSLIKESTHTYGTLSSAQKEAYDSLMKMSNLNSLKIIEFEDYSAVQDSGRIFIDLSFMSCRNITFQMRNLEYTSDNLYNYYGELVPSSDSDTVCNFGSIAIVNNQSIGMILGRLIVGDMRAAIYTLGDGIYALAIMQYEPGAHSCGVLGEEFDNITVQPIEFDCDYNREVKILVLFLAGSLNHISPSMREDYMNAYSAFNIFLHNTVLSNSEVPYQVFRAGYEFVDGGTLSISPSPLAAVDDLANSAYVQNLRDYYNADVVAGIVGTGFLINNVVGQARSVGSINGGGFIDEDYAFVVVDGGYNIIEPVFSHEVAHIMDCHHEVDNEYPNPGYAYGYSFVTRYLSSLWVTGRYRTNVTHPDLTSSNEYRVIEYLSNPNVYYSGKATGTSVNNNARRYKEMYHTIGSFRKEASSFNTTVDIQRPFLEDREAPNCNVVATVSELCGVGPYEHTWYATYGGLLWMNLGTGSSKTITGGYGTILIKVVSTSGIGVNMQTVTRQVAINTNCPDPTIFLPEQRPLPHDSLPSFLGAKKGDEFTLFPNPNNGTFTLECFLAVPQQVHVRLTDITGRFIEEFTKEPTDTSNKMHIRPSASLTPGLYMVTITSRDRNQTIKVTVQ